MDETFINVNIKPTVDDNFEFFLSENLPILGVQNEAATRG